MDAYKQIMLELNGIESLLKSYDKTSRATAVIPKLESAVKERNKESVLYCLNIIIEWYDNNMNDIYMTLSVFNVAEEHGRLYKKVKELRDSIYELEEDTKSNSKNQLTTTPLIFLSHSSTDQKYGDALEKFIMSLGINKEQLIYTSHPLHKIPLGENIYEYLRKNISRDMFMIFLWSDDYLDNPACLNEMGAAWLAQCDYMNVFVPNFNFNNPKIGKCAVDIQKMGIDLGRKDSCKQSMLELKDKLMELFDLSIDEKEILYYIDVFINNI